MSLLKRYFVRFIFSLRERLRKSLDCRVVWRGIRVPKQTIATLESLNLPEVSAHEKYGNESQCDKHRHSLTYKSTNARDKLLHLQTYTISYDILL